MVESIIAELRHGTGAVAKNLHVGIRRQTERERARVSWGWFRFLKTQSISQ